MINIIIIAALSGCLQYHSVLVDTSASCESVPTIDRALGTHTMVLNGEDHLLLNYGNEIRMWGISNPLSPDLEDQSYFNVPNVGDSDYDLLNFSVCDECRYGSASYKAGMILFDFGTNTIPDMGDKEFYPDARDVPGAFTFSYQSQQYLVTKGVTADCDNDSALYEFGSPRDLAFVSCVEVPGRYTAIVGGLQPREDVFYLVDKTSRVYIYSFDGTNMKYHSRPWVTSYTRGLGIDIDGDTAIVTNSPWTESWDISDPINPVYRFDISTDIRNRVSIRSGKVFLARSGFSHSETTLGVRADGTYFEMDPAFWLAANPWNYPGCGCCGVMGGSISSDGSALYRPMYSRLQVVDMSQCVDDSAIFADGFESGDMSAWE